MSDLSKLNTVELTERLVSTETKFNELKEKEDPNSVQLRKVGAELSALESEAAERNNAGSSLTSSL